MWRTTPTTAGAAPCASSSAEFRGLSGSAKGKAVLAAAGLSREPLSRLVVDGRIDPVVSGKLLEAMRENSKPVPPAAARHHRAGAFRGAL